MAIKGAYSEKLVRILYYFINVELSPEVKITFIFRLTLDNWTFKIQIAIIFISKKISFYLTSFAYR